MMHSETRKGRGWRGAKPSRAVAAAVCAALLAVAVMAGQYRAGRYVHHLKPSEWWLLLRGTYRYDPERWLLRQGAPGHGMVALTFDDGPQPQAPAILDVLAAHNAHATFFLVGTNVKKRPAAARRMAAEGHALASHSRSHARLTDLRPEQIRNEIRNNNIVIRRATGVEARLFRPPGGQYDDRVLAEAARQGMTTVLWSNNTGDWRRRDPEWLVRRVLSDVQDGDIVLLHETLPETLEALPAILEGLRARGLRAVTVPELMAASGYGGAPPPSRESPPPTGAGAP